MLGILDRLDYAGRLAREQQIGSTFASTETFAWSRTSLISQWLSAERESIFWIRGKPGKWQVNAGELSGKGQ